MANGEGLPRAHLGVDVGTTAIKIAELLDRGGGQIELVTYAYANLSVSRSWRRAGIFDEAAATEVAAVLKQMMERARVSADAVIFSLPSGHLFSFVVKLPDMPDEQLWPAVLFKAEAVVPLGMDEIVLAVTRPGDAKQKFIRLDKERWHKNDRTPENKIRAEGKQDGLIEALITAVPERIISWYADLAKKAGLNLVATEGEVFSLMRTRSSQESAPILFCSVGWGETSFYVVRQNTVVFSRTIDYSYQDRKTRFNSEPLVTEAKRIAAQYSGDNKDQILRVVLSGGGALEPQLKAVMVDYFGPDVTVSNPFRGLAYPQGLEDKLMRVAPLFTVAIGLARREIEET